MSLASETEQRPVSGLARTELAMRMLCAWNNIPPDKAPPEWFNHPGDKNRMAWERVAQAAQDYLSACLVDEARLAGAVGDWDRKRALLGAETLIAETLAARASR